jgi:RNA polymerase sigma-70 factor, ECF subfamily
MEENVKKQEDISLEKLKAGDRAEYARMVELYSTQIYRAALKILGDPQDAEDVLQETFIKAMKSIRTFEGRSSLSTWLYRIAVNEALMMVRKSRPDLVSIDAGREESEEQSEPVEIVDWCCLPEGDFLTAESRLFLDQAVQRLTPALRSVFVLRDIEGMSVRETAEALGISETAVKNRLLRARLKLREELSVYYAERVSEMANNE